MTPVAPTEKKDKTGDRQDVGNFSQSRLIMMRFKRHKLGLLSLFVLCTLYLLAVFAEFFSPHSRDTRDLTNQYCPPTVPHFSLTDGFTIPASKPVTDPLSFKRGYVIDESLRVALGIFVKGDSYTWMGVITWNRHFLGVDLDRFNPPPDWEGPPPRFYLFGGDSLGRDIFSRLLYGARLSLFVGILGIIFTFILGIVLGGISGYAGGRTDLVIQRVIEIKSSLPELPLWLALAAAVPREWSPIAVYFAITVLLSLLHWTGLARVVRGKILSLREEDYAVAARLLGASPQRVLFRHLIPGFTSHIIVTLTLRVPGMILGETALSFLGLGLKPPVVSWGVMLQDCIDLEVVANYPWMLAPVGMIIITVLAFNFVGDALRDAADPYSSH